MNCLCCGKPIDSKSSDYEKEHWWHKKCILAFFSTSELPYLEISNTALSSIADRSTRKGYTVPGVQKKLSLHLSREKKARLTVVDYPAGYILKPQTEEFSQLPEAEYLVMQMAASSGIKVVPHALLKIDDIYSFITKRIDRKISKEQTLLYAMEDFCQLNQHLTQDKYRGSYEVCAKIIHKYSSRPGLDMTELFMRLVFCFISGNSDMHLKNFSLIETEPGSRQFYLSDAYDLLPVNIIMPEDTEETALTLNGKKRNLHRNDFLKFADGCGIPKKTAEKLIDRFIASEDNYIKQIEESYLSAQYKESFLKLLDDRITRLKKQV